jgi:hypothetical protein
MVSCNIKQNLVLGALMSSMLVTNGVAQEYPPVTILHESFSGTNTVNLVGTTTADGNNWTGSTVFKADGSQSGGAGDYECVFLAIPGGALPQGPVYTLTAWVTTNAIYAVASDKLIFGFSTESDAGSSQYPYNGTNFTGYAAAGIANNATYRLWDDQANNGNITVQGSNFEGMQVDIVLDTTNASDYMTTFYESNGTNVLAGPYSIGAPLLTHIWIGMERRQRLDVAGVTLSKPGSPPSGTLITIK